MQPTTVTVTFHPGEQATRIRDPAHAALAFREVLPLLHKGEQIVVWVPAGEGMPEPVVYEVELVDVAPKPAPSYSAVH